MQPVYENLTKQDKNYIKKICPYPKHLRSEDAEDFYVAIFDNTKKIVGHIDEHGKFHPNRRIKCV